MAFLFAGHRKRVLSYPQPIPEDRLRDLIYIYDSRFDCPQVSDRDLTKGTNVSSLADGTGPAPGPLADFGDYSDSNIYYPMCCYTVNSTIYDWGLGDKSFIFTNVMIREFNAGAMNCLWMRRGDGSSGGYAISWEIYIQPDGAVILSGDSVTTVTLPVTFELDKYYQLGIVLDRNNNKVRVALTEYVTGNRTESIVDLPADWIGHNFTSISANYSRPSAGGYAAASSTSTNRKTLNGAMGHFYMYGKVLSMKEI